MSISYEQAKALKEAGFPHSNLWHDTGHWFSWDGGKLTPTLSQLIDACGTHIKLEVFKDKNSYANCCDRKQHEQKGSTPEEAVMNLWIALNKK